ncbi:MAG: LPS export ABC transporter periplasmic protein LptC [Methylococcales symbiont of Hymedesmia sp. n. MRB-2018]|nr:MAG: LPS export ABC transporter periplasmic protein LptC [Methylococcales symbiont of Hymedesmia sp. n. MRB-2018]KAF3984619.1 MAG: LPS export ABC transporter periplasmic protein LptC [Methylococcales symbiont of Hymedesmia sp. n. MRB-2018]
MTASQYKIYAVLTILLLGLWFLADIFEQKETQKVAVSAHSPDYFSVGYYKKEMDVAGNIKNELNADKMTHYSDDGTTHLEQPVMTLYNSDAPPWVIKAETGILEADGDHLLLAGKVFISREGTEKLNPFNINTAELKVYLSVSYAETDQWAEIIDGSNRTEGIGLETTFSYPVKVKFLSNVKGRYEIN